MRDHIGRSTRNWNPVMTSCRRCQGLFRPQALCTPSLLPFFILLFSVGESELLSKGPMRHALTPWAIRIGLQLLKKLKWKHRQKLYEYYQYLHFLWSFVQKPTRIHLAGLKTHVSGVRCNFDKTSKVMSSNILRKSTQPAMYMSKIIMILYMWR